MTRHLHIIIAAALCMGITSCKEELGPVDVPEVPMTDPAAAGAWSKADVSSLTFNWNKVHSVNQYGFVLSNDKGEKVQQGITKQTSLTFASLKPSTEYTLTIEAFSTGTGVAKKFSISARTLDVKTLGTPEGFRRSPGNVVAISWDEVWMAAGYKLSLLDANLQAVSGASFSDLKNKDINDDLTTTPGIKIYGLEYGTYALRVNAISDSEAYFDGPEAFFTFTTDRKLKENKAGMYSRYDAKGVLINAEPRSLDLYDDGSWVLAAFYGAEGYDLEFSPGDGTFTVLNPAKVSEDVSYVATGVSSPAYEIAISQASGASWCALDTADKGSYIGFRHWDGSYDEFIWDAPGVEVTPPSYPWKYKAIGAVCADEEYDATGGYDGRFPDVENIEVETYEEYVLIRGFAGVDGYDLKFTFDEEANVTSVTTITGGVEGKPVTGGNYAALYTGLSGDWSYIQAYIDNGYCYGWSDEEGGYLLLNAYTKNGSWIYYNIEWEPRTEAGAGDPWTAIGRMSCTGIALDSQKAALEFDGNDSYTIHAFAGSEGYDLSFTITPGGSMHFSSGVEYRSFRIIPLSSEGSEYFHQDSYSSFRGNSTSGEINFTGSLYGSWSFIW